MCEYLKESGTGPKIVGRGKRGGVDDAVHQRGEGAAKDAAALTEQRRIKEGGRR